MPTAGIFSIKDMCSIAQTASQSAWGTLWTVITNLWPWYWLFIVVALVGWIVFEIATRNGTAHYNSENGFSPPFNSFVGAGAYFGLQAVLFVIFHLIFGDLAYCMTWPYAVHATVFLSVGLILHLSGFWPYLREPGRSRKKYQKRKYR